MYKHCFLHFVCHYTTLKTALVMPERSSQKIDEYMFLLGFVSTLKGNQSCATCA